MQKKKVHTRELKEIGLPTSKSISNRLLVLNALLNSKLTIKGLSSANDTKLLQKALGSDTSEVRVGNAGTAFRFLTAYYGLTSRSIELHGNEEMEKRPIRELVEVINSLGGNITYLKKEGYPPLKFKKSKLQSKRVKISGAISSQYISALVMIAPFLPNGLVIEIIGELKSKSYLQMTIDLMKTIGFDIRFNDNLIEISSQKNVKEQEINVEADWSSASYWYSYLAFSKVGDELILKNLSLSSIQGDVITAKLYEQFGIRSKQIAQGVLIKKESECFSDELSFNFASTPDIVQTIAVTCTGLGVKGTFLGVSHLKYKETDRLKALTTELAKLNVTSTIEDDQLIIERKQKLPKQVDINTYKDHRMAMSFAPLAKLGIDVCIEEPSVVEKSYPSFWSNFEE